MRFQQILTSSIRRLIKEYELDCAVESERWINSSGKLCQPDFFLVLPTRVILFEAKLSFTLQGIEQLLNQYAPALGAIYHRPVVCIQICKNLKPDAERFESVSNFIDAVTAKHEGPFIFHAPFPKELS